jgi:hypothetical protein
MALVNLKTNLKSLKYGRDRVGGGDSGQPYIQTPIPGNNPLIPNIGIFGGSTGGEDFLLRGGTLTPSRVTKDVSRLTKMFTDLKSPNGVLFTAKQNVLSRVGVKSQASGLLNGGIYTPLSTLLQAAGTPFGVHFNKQGLNPARNTSLDERAIRSPWALPVYGQTVKSTQKSEDNRLVQLQLTKLPDNPLLSSSATGRAARQARRAQRRSASNASFASLTTPRNQISRNDQQILRYGGGPGSFLGVGLTTIRRYTNTQQGVIDLTNPDYNQKYYGQTPLFELTQRFKGNYESIPTETWFSGVSSLRNLFSTYLSIQQTNTEDGLNFSKNPNFKGRYYVLNSSSIRSKPSSKDTTNIEDFRTSLLFQQARGFKKNILSRAPNYKTANIENRVNLGDPGKRDKNTTSYEKGLVKPDGTRYRALDKITAMPLYRLEKANHSGDRNDLVKFSIGIIDNTDPSKRVYIHFRAFLDSMDDNYATEWNDFRYMGRGEKFYRYNGFSRTVNLSWTVAAQSKEELIPMYQKLNFLASSLTPDYSPQGYMRGNLAVLTVGGYLFEQPGIINSINYSVPQESPWEIGINDSSGTVGSDHTVKELPHIIKVTGFQFIPIHEFVPRLQQNTYEGVYENGSNTLREVISKFGKKDEDTVKERYIALSRDTTLTGNTTNYNPENDYTWGVDAIARRKAEDARGIQAASSQPTTNPLPSFPTPTVPSPIRTPAQAAIPPNPPPPTPFRPGPIPP